MSDKKVHIQGFSQEITLRRNARIRRLSIKVSLGSGVVVCIPRGISENISLEFILKNKVWIEKNLSKEKFKPKPIPNEISLINCQISFLEIEHNKPSIKKEDESFYILIPKTLDAAEKEKVKRNLLNKVLRVVAKVFLPKRVDELATLHNFKYGKVTLRNQKTRWGSCSYTNNISLNIQLMRLPLHLIDYVIIHELCHTVHKNHSHHFWNLVHQKMGNSLYECKKEMQNITLDL